MINVWTYWEGEKPDYIKLCLASIRMQCYRTALFHHITEDNIDHYIPEGILHPSWKSIRVLGIKSDCVRAAVLYLYGGLYVDADTVALKPLNTAIDEDAECCYMMWSNPPARCIAGYLYCKPGSNVARQWLDNINANLADGKADWCQLGERSLTPAIKANESKCHKIPLDTFLPIEIDTSVQQFFTEANWRSYITANTVAFGLNHSWMMHRKRALMLYPVTAMGESTYLVHQLLFDAYQQRRRPHITVCVPTYRRKPELCRLLHSFEHQDYPFRNLVALDDSGELEPCTGHKWRLECVNRRAPSLGAKRNQVASLMGDETDALVQWDDDDLAMPWALSAIAKALEMADWARPSLALLRSPNSSVYHQVRTWNMPEQTDKGFHPSWGMSVAAFLAAGGYPDDVSLGEDLQLAKKLRTLHTSEADPLESGEYLPYYLTAPWPNEHFSYKIKDYEAWPQHTPKHYEGPVWAEPSIPLEASLIDERVYGRPFGGNWWEGDIK